MDTILTTLYWWGRYYLLLLIVTIGYVKALPDTAYIISGLRKKNYRGKGKYQDSVSGASG